MKPILKAKSINEVNMSNLSKVIFSLAILSTSSYLFAKDCPTTSGKYGDGIQYQDAFCRIFVTADKIDSTSNRNIIFTNEGLIQVFSNFPGTTNSNSTGARVYYLFPFRTDKKINAIDASHLSVTHPSGVQFEFDKNGRLSSPDLKMKVSKEINSKNKSGIEIESYPKGIVIDLGYRMGNTPTLNKNAVVTITDKNQKKCVLANSEINKIDKDNAELIYKTNESLHKFLAKRCSQLDISDLLAPASDNLKVVSKPSRLGASPSIDRSGTTDDSKRSPKPDSLDSLIQTLEKNGSTTNQR
jgi:hypothetical protein